MLKFELNDIYLMHYTSLLKLKYNNFYTLMFMKIAAS